jgi:hypothetical protein
MAKIEFFRVGNGDMTLITFDSGKTLLIDCNIRKAADDAKDDTPDVAAQLKKRLKTDASGRPFVDAMLNSHPDQDHISGFKTHFHMGPLSDYVKGSDKIVIMEMWSSPLVFRRASKTHVLHADAKAWSAEARRRVKGYEKNGFFATGERILILGEDENGKTDGLGAIMVKTDKTWATIGGAYEFGFEGLLLAPLKADNDEEEEAITKNNSSVIARFKIGTGVTQDACRLLTGGDAEVAIWEKLWDRHKNAKDSLLYDILQTPHHCSWHSLSWDSWSQVGEDAEVSEKARSALSQARKGAKLIASSKEITDDDADPPCVRAEREYKSIAEDAEGEFICVGDDGPEPLAFTIDASSIKRSAARATNILTSGLVRQSASAPQVQAAVRKEGGGRYA